MPASLSIKDLCHTSTDRNTQDLCQDSTQSVCCLDASQHARGLPHQHGSQHAIGLPCQGQRGLPAQQHANIKEVCQPNTQPTRKTSAMPASLNTKDLCQPRSDRNTQSVCQPSTQSVCQPRSDRNTQSVCCLDSHPTLSRSAMPTLSRSA